VAANALSNGQLTSQLAAHYNALDQRQRLVYSDAEGAVSGHKHGREDDRAGQTETAPSPGPSGQGYSPWRGALAVYPIGSSHHQEGAL